MFATMVDARCVPRVLIDTLFAQYRLILLDRGLVDGLLVRRPACCARFPKAAVDALLPLSNGVKVLLIPLLEELEVLLEQRPREPEPLDELVRVLLDEEVVLMLEDEQHRELLVLHEAPKFIAELKELHVPELVALAELLAR